VLGLQFRSPLARAGWALQRNIQAPLALLPVRVRRAFSTAQGSVVPDSVRETAVRKGVGMTIKTILSVIFGAVFVLLIFLSIIAFRQQGIFAAVAELWPHLWF
jgi:hypothetical protein